MKLITPPLSLSLSLLQFFAANFPIYFYIFIASSFQRWIAHYLFINTYSTGRNDLNPPPPATSLLLVVEENMQRRALFRNYNPPLQCHWPSWSMITFYIYLTIQCALYFHMCIYQIPAVCRPQRCWWWWWQLPMRHFVRGHFLNLLFPLDWFN